MDGISDRQVPGDPHSAEATRTVLEEAGPTAALRKDPLGENDVDVMRDLLVSLS
jgi:hypothetical protein